MPYMNDTATLAQAIGPAYVAQQAGQQNEQEQIAEGLKNTLSQAQLPAEAQKPELANLFQQAQTAQQQALTTGETLKNIGTAGTLGSNIAATNVGNQLKISQDQVAKLNTIGQIAGSMASYLDGVDPPARAGVMHDMLTAQGIDPSKLGPLASGDPERLRQVATSIVHMSPQFQTAAMEAGSKENIAATETAGHIQSSKILAGSREDVAKINQETKKQLAPLTAVIGELTAKAAAGKATPEELKVLQWAQNSQQLIRSGSPFQAGITGTNVQGNVPPVPTSSPSTTQPAVQQPPPEAMQSAAKTIWPNDDPTKYDYRMDSDGNLQRKPK